MKRITKADLLKRNAELNQKLVELVTRPDSYESELIRTEVKYSVATEVAIMYGEPSNIKSNIESVFNSLTSPKH